MHAYELLIWETIIVFALKVICFTFGFLIVRLGYTLIREGVKGEFNFSADFTGLKGGLVSSSPGLLFVALGVVLIGYAMYVNKPIEMTYSQAPSNSQGIPHAHKAGESEGTTIKVDSLK